MGSASSLPAVYDHPARAVTVAFTVLTTLAIVARILARHLSQSKMFQADDILANVAYITNLAQLICVFLLIDADTMSLPGLVSMSPKQQGYLLRVYLTMGILYTLTIATVKLALLLLMRRIFTLNRPIFRYLWYGLFIFMVMWTGAVFGLLGWQQENSDLNNSIVGRIGTPVMGAFNALTDVLILVLPLWSIKNLHLPARRRVGLAAIFAIGLCAAMVSIVRVIFMSIPAAKSWNPAYQNFTDIVLSAAETSTCLLGACLTVSHVFWVKFNEVAMNSMHDLTYLLTSRGSGSQKASGSFSNSVEPPNSLKSRAAPDSITRIDQVGIEIGTLKQSEPALPSHQPWVSANP